MKSVERHHSAVELKWGVVFGQSAQLATYPNHRLKLQRFPYSINPLDTLRSLSEASDYCYLLESSDGPRRLAQFSFIGFSPSTIVRLKDGHYEQLTQDERSTSKGDSTPLSFLSKILSENFITYRGFRFVGGIVGYFSYDFVRYLESLPKNTSDDLDFPDFEFGVYDDGIVLDHLTGQAYYYWYNKNRLDQIERLMSKRPKPEKLSLTKPQTNIGRREFESMVGRAKRFVRSGDIFQIVLSRRLECSFKGDLTEFYSTLRRINPSPYMYYLKMEERAIVGSSPEMLGRVDGRCAETFPIAGTRPVLSDPGENARLEAELLRDPKERAEHVMLIDLARNDLGKVCEYGSVKVSDFMKVQRFSHVQHIVSRVNGRLRPDSDAIDALQAIFPAGTVSGAPKRRAMELIEELESTRRGPYAGAVGYFSYNGNADFAITIRTLFAQKNRAYVQSGAGIVADSKPSSEWRETEHKARVLLDAMEEERI
jgi:anthranilate synthase component 1